MVDVTVTTPPQKGEGATGAAGEGPQPSPKEGDAPLTQAALMAALGSLKNDIMGSVRHMVEKAGGNKAAEGTPAPAGKPQDAPAEEADYGKMPKAELAALLQEKTGRLAALEAKETARASREAESARISALESALGISRADGKLKSSKFANVDLLLDSLNGRTRRGQDGEYLVQEGDKLRPLSEVVQEYGAQQRFQLPASGEGSGVDGIPQAPGSQPGPAQPNFASMSNEQFKAYADKLAGQAAHGDGTGSTL